MINTGKKRLQRGLVGLCCSLLLAACATAESTNASSEMVERVIVQFKTQPAKPSEAVAQLAQQYHLGMVYERELGGGFYIAQLKPPLSKAALQAPLARIALDPMVSNIEADLMMHTMPNQ